MAITVANSLSIEEMREIKETLRLAQMEIIKPGSSKSRGHDLDDAINDALYRLWDAIERAERLEADAA
jgi:hypothetical protein